jgi:hypothetical protein
MERIGIQLVLYPSAVPKKVPTMLTPDAADKIKRD